MAHINVKVDYVTSLMEHSQMKNGLWNTFWNTTSGEQSNGKRRPCALGSRQNSYVLQTTSQLVLGRIALMNTSSRNTYSLDSQTNVS